MSGGRQYDLDLFGMFESEYLNQFWVKKPFKHLVFSAIQIAFVILKENGYEKKKKKCNWEFFKYQEHIS